jgi:hypothetical protein
MVDEFFRACAKPYGQPFFNVQQLIPTTIKTTNKQGDSQNASI